MKIVHFNPGVLDLVLYSALSKNVTYIVYSRFSGLRVKKFNFDHSLTCALFGAQQKCDKHRTFFRFTKRKKSSLIVLCFELYTARSRNRTYIAHFFRFWDWKSSSSINLYLVLYWARTWIATNNILSKLSFLKISRSIIDVISVFCKKL